MPGKPATSRANMQNEIKLKKSQLDKFRRLARHSPNEIQAYLIGEVVNPNLTVVDSFEYPPSYSTSTPSNVAWFTADYEVMQQKAERRGRRVVGFMHNHPNYDAVVSPADYEIMIAYGYRVCGICSVYGNKTRPRFWIMDSALPCEMTYAKAKRASI